MARSHARLHVSIWGDDDFKALSAEAQRLYVLIVSQPGLSWAGVAAYTPKRWAGLASNTKPSLIVRALGELVAGQFVVLDKATEEVWVRTFVRHNDVLKQPNVKTAMLESLSGIASPAIREAFRDEYPHIDWNPSPNPSGNHSGKGSGNPSTGAREKEKEKEKENHADVQKFTLSPEPFARELGADEPKRLDGLVGLTVVRERETS